MLTTTKYHERLCPSGQGRFFHAVFAQLAEQWSPKPQAAGSIPAYGAMLPTFVSGTTIAAGSAYPAHNRTQTENCVTKPWFYIEKGTPSYEA